jgi:hypothetical protein
VHLCDVAVNGVGLGQRLPVHFQDRDLAERRL